VLAARPARISSRAAVTLAATAHTRRAEPGGPDAKRIRELVAFCNATAWWLDDCLRLPGTNFRLGLDAAVGLIPLAGDVLGFGVSALTMIRALRAGVPRALLMKMGRNVLIDAVGSFIPVIGDVFDTVFKAHRRNFALLREHYADQLPETMPLQRGTRISPIITTLVLIVITYVIARLV